MSRLLRVIAIAFGFGATGCAIHPLPEDVTGVDTYTIVRQIRCEARDTLRTIVIGWLAQLGTVNNDPFLLQLATGYENDPASINSFHPDLFKGPRYSLIRSTVKTFYDAGMAYTFDLTGTETNNFDPSLTFTQNMLHSKVTLGVSGGLDRIRQNQRQFTVTDTFSKLLTKVPEQYCDGKLVRANYIYPIVGRIGIDKTIKSFIELTLFGGLTTFQSGAGVSAPPTMTDNLVFTTTIKSNLNPAVVFTPITNAFQLTNASLLADNNRADRHQVTIGLAIDKGTGFAELGPLRSFLFSANRVAPTSRPVAATTNGLLVGGRVTGGGTVTEQLAVIAVDQVKSQEIRIVPAQ
jgi:hypothetical protein